MKDSGDVELWVNNKKINTTHYSKGQREAIAIAGIEQHLRTGQNKVEVRCKNTKTPLSGALYLQYQSRQPASVKNCPFILETQLTGAATAMGKTVRYSVTLTNKTDAAIANPLVKLGIPAGLSLPHWQLKEMQEKEQIAYYEIFNGYLVYYLDALPANEVVELHIDLKADVPGSYEAAASVAYPYYDNEWEVWSAPGKVDVMY